jgi:mono/diheme cytochrome c family protein
MRAAAWLLGVLVVLAVVAAASTGCKPSKGNAPATSAAKLAFVRDGKAVRELTRDELIRDIPPETVEGFDPYYGKTKRFRALPLRRVLERGFGAGGLATEQFVLRASDGYTVPMNGSLLVEDGAYLAFEDLDVPGWEPIGPQHANPGPFYLVWSKPTQTNLDAYPRPWQLETIEIARFDAVFPHTSPGPAAPESVTRGYALFRERCIRCHAINREGGHVGPDLNVPQNVTEYRPEAQIRAYIRNPATFRYGNMPAHPDLTDSNLDDLIAYLRAMKDRKHDDAH